MRGASRVSQPCRGGTFHETCRFTHAAIKFLGLEASTTSSLPLLLAEGAAEIVGVAYIAVRDTSSAQSISSFCIAA